MTDLHNESIKAACAGAGGKERGEATTRYGFQQVGEVDVFYREAGPQDAPTILLLHGFPTASHMFRDLIPLLADRFRLIAPDLPGFGQTKAPPRGTFDYTFERLADVIEAFTEAMWLDRYALYIFDYGAPVGLRLSMRHPERVAALISQNGNAYIDGFSDEWGPWEGGVKNIVLRGNMVAVLQLLEDFLKVCRVVHFVIASSLTGCARIM
jgi:pimeloyl-ACP methyl ester carboxylesterase